AARSSSTTARRPASACRRTFIRPRTSVTRSSPRSRRSAEAGAVPDRRIWDISRAVGESTAVWPGDTPFTRRWVMRIEDGCSCNLPPVPLSVLCGTPADAPFHFQRDGFPIDQVDLGKYVGPCLVMPANSRDCLRPADLAGVDLKAAERLLVRGPDRL